MRIDQLQASLLKLTPTERRQFAAWFDGHRHELLCRNVSSAVRDELAQRLKEAKEHPEILERFEEADVERMFNEMTAARIGKTSAR